MGKIIIRVSPKGETRIATQGFSGGSCKAASKPFEDALGAKLSDKPTSEMYSAQSATQEYRSTT